MNGLEFRKEIKRRGFKFNETNDAWCGPNGLTLSDDFITIVDDYHTSRVQDQMLEAIDRGATSIMAFFESVRPLRVRVVYK